MQIAVANMNDLDAAYAVLLGCKRALDAQGLMQWDTQYPSKSFFSDAIAKESLFVLSSNRCILGVVVLNESQPPEWSTTAWRVQQFPFLVIHAFAIAPHLQGHGLGRKLLRFCEDFAVKRGYASIRLDAFSENTSALSFYERQGYTFRGEVQLAFKPLGHQCYYCYEKSLLVDELSSRSNEPITVPVSLVSSANSHCS